MLQSKLESLQLQTCYGNFIWPVRGFKALRESGKMVASPYFYSWQGGYKLRILLYPRGNGEGEGTHLSISLHILDNGEFDEILSRSYMSGNTEIALLSQ